MPGKFRGWRSRSSRASTRSRGAKTTRGSSVDESHTTVLAADGTRLFVRSRDGAARNEPRLFLSDGVLCDGFIWKYLWEHLAPLAPLTHWHYRGHGRSTAPADPERIDIAAHANDLARIRAASGDPPCVLFGHSMGCQVALESYRTNPDRVRGLVLVCGSFGKVTSTFHGGPYLELILPKLLSLANQKPELVRAIWSRIPTEMALKVALKMGEVDPQRLHPEDFLPYLRHMTHVDFPMFLRMVRAAGEHSAENMLGDIRVPTLIVAGSRDTFTPPFLAEAMKQAIPSAELLMVDGGSHVLPIEQPDRVNAAITTFLRERVLT